MRTKTLLTAVAALAAGISISQAQPVYSANVVGYANVVTPGNGGINYLIEIPFQIGVSNGANEIWPNGLPDTSTILIWDSGTSSYSTAEAFAASPTGWFDPSSGNPIPPPVLPVGQGFFLNPATPITNVFSGTVVVNVGTTNLMDFSSANGGINYLVGCAVPYAGAVTNGTDSGGGANLNGLPDTSTVLIWDPNTSSYSTVEAFAASPTGWFDPASGNPVPPPSITVGEGFFLNPASPYVWKTGL